MNGALWVTGLGLVTPLGLDAETTWARIVRGDRALHPVRLFGADGQRSVVVGEVQGIGQLAAEGGAAWSRTSAMALRAAREAMAMAGVDVRRHRVGLVVGGTTGGMFENEQVLARLHAEPDCREILAQLLSHPLTATGDCLNDALGPFARVRTLASACSSGANAVVVAASWLLSGEVDVVVAGGADALCRLTLSGFNALGALDPAACRPFHRTRRGTNLGEGAAFLVIERAEHAAARATHRCVAELAGWAAGAEAHHVTNPAADGVLVSALIEQALDRANLSPCDVDYVNAHGTGTSLNDAMEAAALARALGGEIGRVPVASSKGQIGHTLGAAGAIEAALTALCVSRRTLAPTAGLDDPDPALGLLHLPHAGREVGRVKAALSHAFGFGGMDTVLVFADPRRGAQSTGAVASPAARAASAQREVVVTGAAVFGAWGLLDAEACAAKIHEGGPGHAPGARLTADPDAHLDAARARRLDHAARLAVVAVQRALERSGGAHARTGVLLGSAYGNIDASAAFMHRIFDKGPRAANPADFPNLVPSSAAGHVSIYLGLRGVTFATADLAASGESAVAQAAQFVRTGVADQLAAGAVEPKSDIVDRVLSSLFAYAPSQAGAERADLAAAVVLESAEHAGLRGAAVLARVRWTSEWREAAGDAPPVDVALPAPAAARAEVWLPRVDSVVSALLATGGWASAPRRLCAPALGESDALGAASLVAAVGRIASGEADEVLVVGRARGRGHAVLLAR